MPLCSFRLQGYAWVGAQRWRASGRPRNSVQTCGYRSWYSMAYSLSRVFGEVSRDRSAFAPVVPRTHFQISRGLSGRASPETSNALAPAPLVAERRCRSDVSRRSRCVASPQASALSKFLQNRIRVCRCWLKFGRASSTSEQVVPNLARHGLGRVRQELANGTAASAPLWHRALRAVPAWHGHVAHRSDTRDFLWWAT